MWEGLPDVWRRALEELGARELLKTLDEFDGQQRAEHLVFPARQHVFRALQWVEPSDVKCVILGQDPYHDHGQAHGLAFSVPDSVPFPPSLRNIVKELQSDLGLEAPATGDLTAWAEQGVLLLNTVLTVRAHEPLSHRKQGWEKLTDALIQIVVSQSRPAAFVLWGKPAQKKRSLISTPPHAIFTAAHPSPLSAHRGFFGSRPFSQVNRFLNDNGRDPIDWNLARR